MPTILNEHFTSRIGSQFADAADFLAAIGSQPFYSVRLNPFKPAQHSLPLAEAVEWCPNAYYLADRPNYTLNPLFHAGAFYPQEASSMYLWHVLSHVSDSLPADMVALDLCAAPGGKSTLLASYMKGRGVLVANEVIRSRAWILRENIAKWGADNCVVTNLDPVAFGDAGAMFDLVLIDAPCSGEGMFRKDAAAAEEWTPDNADLCAQRQRRILMDVWDSVVEGGIVIYSTCTFNPAENELNMEWLAQQTDVEFLSVPVPEGSGVTVVPFAGGEGYGFYPHKVKGEGFFVCVMRKLSGRARRRERDKSPKVKVSIPDGMLANASQYSLMPFDGAVVAVPQNAEANVRQLLLKHKALWAGVPLGEAARKEFVPAAELPLSVACAKEAFPHVELDAAEALRYLRGESVAADRLTAGWNIVRHMGFGLGLIKSVGARANNYYPKEWRIRMSF